MAKKIVVTQGEWENPKFKLKYCQELEKGNILFFSEIPFSFSQEDIDFLLLQKQSSSQSRKNIAYKPSLDRITNHDTKDAESSQKLLKVLRSYSQSVVSFLSTLLSPYAPDWKLDYASFRPFQEKGRKLRMRARNDLLHVDSFPTRPLHGMRILRFFTNINPTAARQWITSESFEELTQKYAGEKGVTFPPSSRYSSLDLLQKKIGGFLKKLGIPLVMRSPYDHFMIGLHHYLKENAEFQANCPKDLWDFPPNSCWAVFTDQVSHAAIAGQYALEQTLLIPHTSLLYPERSPVAILERLSGRSMIDAELSQS